MNKVYPSIWRNSQARSPTQTLQSKFYEIPLMVNSNFRQNSVPRRNSRLVILTQSPELKQNEPEQFTFGGTIPNSRLSPSIVELPKIKILERQKPSYSPRYEEIYSINKKRSISELGKIRRRWKQDEKIIRQILKPCQLLKRRTVKEDLPRDILQTEFSSQKTHVISHNQINKPSRTTIFSKLSLNINS